MGLKSSTKTETNVYELEVIIDAAKFQNAVLKVYNRQKGKINVPGFRKGKAPLPMVKKLFGNDFFDFDALELLYSDVFEGAYEAAGLTPVDSPFDLEMDNKGNDGMFIKFKITVKPEVEISDYKGIEAVKETVEVTSEDITNEIERMRERNSRLVTVEDRPAKDGDIAVIDFEGFVDGVAFEGGKGENHSLNLGSGQFIPGFEEQVAGHNAGDEFDIDVTFPEDYSEELAGKAAVFKIKLHEIKVKELPEVDDEFAKDLGEYDTVDELKAGIEKDLLKDKQEHADTNFKNQILDALVEKVVAEIPEVMFEKKQKENIDNFASRISQQGIDLDTYLMYMGTERGIFEEQMLDDAKKQVKLTLALEKITSLENLSVSDEDIESEYSKIAEMYGLDVDKVKTIVPADSVRDDLMNDAAVKFVVDNASVTEAAKQEEKPAKKAAAKKTPAKKSTAKKDEGEKAEKTAAAKKSATPKKAAEKKDKDAE